MGGKLKSSSIAKIMSFKSLQKKRGGDEDDTGAGVATLVLAYGLAKGGNRGRRIPRAFRPGSLASTASSLSVQQVSLSLRTAEARPLASAGKKTYPPSPSHKGWGKC